MHKKRYIYFWHGRSKDIEAEVAKCCVHDTTIDEYYWYDSLDLFAEYFDNFMVLGDQIAVTQHSNFNQRG